VTLGVAGDKPVSVEYALNGKSWKALREAVTSGRSTVVEIPSSLWQESSPSFGKQILLLRVDYGIYKSAPVWWSCWIYPRGFPVVGVLSLSKPSIYVPGNIGAIIEVGVHDIGRWDASEMLTLSLKIRGVDISDH
jgi:hypothetical protein